MKLYKIKLILILSIFSIECFSQSNLAIDVPPKVENYTYGELDLMVVPFGLGKEISIGKVLKDGTIQFDWPDINTNNIESSTVFMVPVKTALLGMNYCEDNQIEENSENCSAISTQYIYLYKNKKQVGVLSPTTDRALLDNEPANIYSNLTMGSSLLWFYSDGDCNYKAKCKEKLEWEGKYNFDRENTYYIHLKKGWNIVQYTLVEIEEFKDENGTGKMEKKVNKKTINQIPKDINWYIKTFVNLD